jgi:hypothetical protein
MSMQRLAVDHLELVQLRWGAKLGANGVRRPQMTIDSNGRLRS